MREGITANRILALTIAGVSVLMDLQHMRIRNGWILCALLAGLGLCIVEGGGDLGSCVLGAVIPIAVLGWLFWFRMLGPGDIKLFCALGALMGPAGILRCIGIAFLAGAALSLAILVFCGDFLERMRYLWSYLVRYRLTGVREPYYRQGCAPENFHFTIPVFMSVMLYAGGMY